MARRIYAINAAKIRTGANLAGLVLHPALSSNRAKRRAKLAKKLAVVADGGIDRLKISPAGGSSDQLASNGGVQHIFSTCCAFAAVMGNGKLITWGDPARGGSIREVSHILGSLGKDVNKCKMSACVKCFFRALFTST